MEFDFEAIKSAALAQNNWHVRGIYQLTGGDGRDTMFGIVVFDRERGPHGPDSGTAHVHVHADAPDDLEPIGFDWGHYDLSMVQAREDFAARIAKGA